MIYTSSRPYPRHSRSYNPRHYRRMTRAQHKKLLTVLRLLTVGVGILLAVAGTGADPAVIANLPLSIFGTLLALVASIGLTDDDSRA